MSIQDNFRLAMRRYVYSVSILSNKDFDGNSNALSGDGDHDPEIEAKINSYL